MKKVFCFLLTLLVTCYTLKDIKDAECHVACLREGAKSGIYSEQEQACSCANFFDYKKITRKQAVPQRLENKKIQSYSSDEEWFNKNKKGHTISDVALEDSKPLARLKT